MISGFNTILGLFQLGAPAPEAPPTQKLTEAFIQQRSWEFSVKYKTAHFPKGVGKIQIKPELDSKDPNVDRWISNIAAYEGTWEIIKGIQTSHPEVIQSPELYENYLGDIKLALSEMSVSSLDVAETDLALDSMTYSAYLVAKNFGRQIASLRPELLGLAKNRNEADKIIFGQLYQYTGSGLDAAMQLSRGLYFKPQSNSAIKAYWNGFRILSVSCNGAGTLSLLGRYASRNENNKPGKTEAIIGFSALALGLATSLLAKDDILGIDNNDILGVMGVGACGYAGFNAGAILSPPPKIRHITVEPAEGPHAAHTPAPAAPATPEKKPKPGTQDGGGPVEEEPNPYEN